MRLVAVRGFGKSGYNTRIIYVCINSEHVISIAFLERRGEKVVSAYVWNYASKSVLATNVKVETSERVMSCLSPDKNWYRVWVENY
jgi:hypothetical protein